MTCNHLLVIGEVLSGKTHYVEQLLESEDNNYKGHEPIWVFLTRPCRWNDGKLPRSFSLRGILFLPFGSCSGLEVADECANGKVSIGLFTTHCRL